MTLLDTPDTHARLFIGLPVPASAQEVIEGALENYRQYLEGTVPKQNWHLTLLFLGEVLNHKQYVSRLTKPLPQAFVPAVSLTHLGRGLKRDQLWAYATATGTLQTVRQTLIARAKAMRMPLPPRTEKDEFTPHITIARLLNVSRQLGLPDSVAATTFTAKEAYLYQSHADSRGVRYTVEGTIPLSA